VVTAVGDGALAATELEKYAAVMHRKTGLHPRMPQSQPRQEPPKAPAADSTLFDDAMLTQLNTVFARMAESLVLKLHLDSRPVSAELHTYMQELAKLTDKLTVEIQDNDHGAPCVHVCRADGAPTGLAFHGVPGGHEFTSFILGLYNAAGPGQPLDADVRAAIHSLGQKNMKVLVSLNCTMCPELVTAAQRIAAENKNITAEVFDINHFPELRETYNVMSVPCLILNDGETVTFGKKNIRQLLDILK
jgi:thioredoxin reductase (NADPH)